MHGTMLLINEIYPAICGESRFAGRPCTLVRLTGCHRRCVWCDSAHSFGGGDEMSVGDVVAEVRRHGLPTVLVTGGEPLLQPAVAGLMQALLDDGRRVLLETSGTVVPDNAVPLSGVPAGVHRIVDVKAPGAGLDGSVIDWDGIATLDGSDEVKIVCADRADYEWARDLVRNGGRWSPEVSAGLSTVHGRLDPADLSAWILDDGLDVRLQLQWHKLVWPGRERGV